MTAAQRAELPPDPLDVEPLTEGRWRVTSASSSHIVDQDPETLEVRCDRARKGFEYRGRCRHVDAVTRFENSEPTEASEERDAGPGLERDVPPPDRDDFDAEALP